MSVPPAVTRSEPGPDYAIGPSLVVETPEQLKAIGDKTRSDILSMLSQRAATTSQLAAALGRPRGSVGHHLKVLEQAGLIRVVRTRKVRALTEKYYGRTARTFVILSPDQSEGDMPFLSQAMSEARVDAGHELSTFTLRHARVPAAAALDFLDRVVQLAEEFAAQRPGGNTVYGFVAGVYATDRPSVSDAPRPEETIS